MIELDHERQQLRNTSRIIYQCIYKYNIKTHIKTSTVYWRILSVRLNDSFMSGPFPKLLYRMFFFLNFLNSWYLDKLRVWWNTRVTSHLSPLHKRLMSGGSQATCLINHFQWPYVRWDDEKTPSQLRFLRRDLTKLTCCPALHCMDQEGKGLPVVIKGMLSANSLLEEPVGGLPSNTHLSKLAGRLRVFGWCWGHVFRGRGF